MSLLRFLLLAAAALAATPASAQQHPAREHPAHPAPGVPSAAELDRLSALLRDDARRAELLRTLEALSGLSRSMPAAAEAPPA
ncbi:MAG TPA: hypothetical protein VE684_19165, partial [Crenalkalicoccus sp.]|nr:hypothetical protein [Crenalkalicoccus sp.]